MEKVSKGAFTFDGEEWEDISAEAKAFIKRMLTYEPGRGMPKLFCLAKRYSAD